MKKNVCQASAGQRSVSRGLLIAGPLICGLLLLSSIATAAGAPPLSRYSIELAGGYSDNVDQQSAKTASSYLATTLAGHWRLQPGTFIPVQLEATFADSHYAAGGSSQRLELGSGLELWQSDTSELTLYSRLHYYQSSRLPTDDFYGLSMTLLALTEQAPFLLYLAQDLQWSEFKQTLRSGGDRQGQQANRPGQNENPVAHPDPERDERTLRTRLGVDLQVTPQWALNGAVSYADNDSTLKPERWRAHGWSLGLQWWPQQFWQGQLTWQQTETTYSRTLSRREDQTDTLSLRVDYQPGSWQYYGRWRWQHNNSSLAGEEYREQDITCGVIYHF